MHGGIQFLGAGECTAKGGMCGKGEGGDDMCCKCEDACMGEECKRAVCILLHLFLFFIYKFPKLGAVSKLTLVQM